MDVCPEEKAPRSGRRFAEVGDAWVYVAIDADTKLIPVYHVGKRHLADTRIFLWNLYGRIEGRTQITTDGLHHYTASIPDTFGLDVDFAQLVKLYGDYGQHGNERYSPSPIVETISKIRTAILTEHTSLRPTLSARTHHAYANAPIHAPYECVF